MSQYRPAKHSITVSVGESVRIVRELQELSQNQLTELTGISQSTLSAIENDTSQPWGGARQGFCSCDEVSPRGAGFSRLGFRATVCGMTNCSDDGAILNSPN